MSTRRILWRNDLIRYGTVSRLLHWLIALMIFIMLGIGWGIDYMPREWRAFAMGIHKSLGIIILFLVIVRLGWRFWNSPPAMPAFMASWERLFAVIIHYALYALLLAMPLTGWVMTSAHGKPVMLFGLIRLPDLVGYDQMLSKQLRELHGDLATILAIVIGLHVAAALHHHFIRKNNVMSRMWPFFSYKQKP